MLPPSESMAVSEFTVSCPHRLHGGHDCIFGVCRNSEPNPVVSEKLVYLVFRGRAATRIHLPHSITPPSFRRRRAQSWSRRSSGPSCATPRSPRARARRAPGASAWTRARCASGSTSPRPARRRRRPPGAALTRRSGRPGPPATCALSPCSCAPDASIGVKRRFRLPMGSRRLSIACSAAPAPGTDGGRAPGRRVSKP